MLNRISELLLRAIGVVLGFIAIIVSIAWTLTVASGPLDISPARVEPLMRLALVGAGVVVALGGAYLVVRSVKA